MQIYTLSDFHFDLENDNERISQRLKRLCSLIRKDPFGGRTVLFILLGDIINVGHKDGFASAKLCLDELRNQLHGFKVFFEMVPGNHDRTYGDITAFDQFARSYGIPVAFGDVKVYSRKREDISFIFADTTWGGKHNEPGQLDVEAIKQNIYSAMLDAEKVLNWRSWPMLRATNHTSLF